MRFRIEKDLLSESILIASRIAGLKTTLAVLSNILIEAESQKSVKISATNLELGILQELDAEVEKMGTTTVPARSFWEFISSLDQREVLFEKKNSSVSVSQGKFLANFATLDPKEFPSIPKGEGGEKSNLDKAELYKAIQKVTFASSPPDEGRPVLTGTLIETKNSEMILVATDGYRLGAEKIKVFKKPKNELKLIIPSRSLMELGKILEGQEKEKVEFEVSEGENQVIFSLPKKVLVTRLIDGQFPAWEKIVPKEVKTNVLVSKNEFQKAVKIASIFAKDSGNVVKLEVQGKSISFFTQTKEVGSQKGEIQAKVTGPGGEIAFNYRYLLEVLNILEGENIVFKMVGPLNPGIFKEEKGDYLHLIMPVRIQT